MLSFSEIKPLLVIHRLILDRYSRPLSDCISVKYSNGKCTLLISMIVLQIRFDSEND
jgi:hypothetical protein